MFDREYLFEILIESLFPDRQDDIAAISGDNTGVYWGKADGLDSGRRQKNESSKPAAETINWDTLVTELEQQAVLGIAALVLEKKSREGMPDSLADRITLKKRQIIMRYTQMAAVQNKICRCLKDGGITAAVMKGMASAQYYPHPSLRTMGDIDLIVKPEDYFQAVALLLEEGVTETSESDTYHTGFTSGGFTIELHRSPGSVHKDVHGTFIQKFILSGLDAVETAASGRDSFPSLPWKQNGMELIWHIRQHLYNGLGLRQVIDWMMFVDHCLDDCKYMELEPALEKSGLKNLAIAVTKMCQKYLGLRQEGISWCREADEQLCDELMDYIMEQGNFGKKKLDDKAAKVMSGYSDLGMMLRELQRRGLENWPAVKKHPFLKPLAWTYALKGSIRIAGESGLHLSSAVRDLKIARRRKKMFGRLYTLGNHEDK